MPPRYSYWTILAGGLPTAFRATEREDLLPTFNRIRDKHSDAEMKWFARGRLWASPEEAQEDLQRVRARRERDWRPGGEHRDPRQKFKDSRRDAKSARSGDKRFDRPKFDDRRSERPKLDDKRFERPKLDGKRFERPKFDGKRSDRPKLDDKRSDRPKLDDKRFERPRSGSHSGRPKSSTAPGKPFGHETKPRRPRPEGRPERPERRPERRREGSPRKRQR